MVGSAHPTSAIVAGLKLVSSFLEISLVVLLEPPASAIAQPIRHEIAVLVAEAADALLSLIELMIVRPTIDQIGLVGALAGAEARFSYGGGALSKLVLLP